MKLPMAFFVPYLGSLWTVYGIQQSGTNYALIWLRKGILRQLMTKVTHFELTA